MAQLSSRQLSRSNPRRQQAVRIVSCAQGTAATALAGMYGAMRVLGRPKRAITEQTFGEAWSGRDAVLQSPSGLLGRSCV